MNEKFNSTNDQIRDSVAQINALIHDEDGRNIRAMSYQIMAHSLALSLYSAVHQQQQMYILQNATTTAAVKEALKSSPADAMELIQKTINGNDLSKTISDLVLLMDKLNETYSDICKVQEDTSSTKQ